MSTRQRDRLFALVALVVLATAAQLAGARSPSETGPAAGPAGLGTPTARPAPELATAPPEQPPAARLEPPNPPGGRDERRAARPVARLFLHALLQLAQHPTAPRPRRALTATASPALARSLLERPPRGRPPAVARLGQTRLYGPLDGQIKASTLVRYRGAGPALLEVTLIPRVGGWQVARLRP